ncbi:MAG: hypothetical protein QM778_17750 [Myxococcales bacterium]
MSRSLALLFALSAVSACSPEVPSPKRTCWHLSGATQADRCEPQACFDKVEQITVRSPLGARLTCNQSQETCAPAPPDQLVENGGPYSPITEYDASFLEGGLMLTFDDRILREGYSLENFRKYKTAGSFVWFETPYNPEWVSGSYDILSYQSSRLRVRVEGDVVSKRSSTLVDPYPCGGPLGGSCTQGWCEYTPAVDDKTQVPIHVIADVELPIQQAAPSPSP